MKLLPCENGWNKIRESLANANKPRDIYVCPLGKVIDRNNPEDCSNTELCGLCTPKD